MRDAVIGLIGLPRSGTTLIHRMMAAHSRVDGVIEPYQQRRAQNYAVTALERFLADFAIAPDASRALAVKETTTRRVNAQHLFALLEAARGAALYTGLVIILRCPFTAYLSQIEAGRDMWKEKKLTEHSPANFQAFVQSARAGLQTVVSRAREQHFRIVTYERFCAAPRLELARLMALIPYRLEPGQLSLSTEEEQRGGDPKAWRSTKVELSDRSAQVAALTGALRGQPGLAFFQELRGLVQREAGQLPDAVVLDHLTELVLTRGM